MKDLIYDGAGAEFASGILDGLAIEKLRNNPRADFTLAVKNMDAAACLIKTAEIHGHYCPGSALGVMATLYGLSLLDSDDTDSDGIMEDLLAIVEVNACFADGIQAVSGCTLGNNSLVYRDFGKHAVTFAVRGRDTGVRVSVRPEFKQYIEEAVPEFYPMVDKVIARRKGGPEDLLRFREIGRDAAFEIIKIPFEKILSAKEIVPVIPGYAPITATYICPECGEQVMAGKVWKRGIHRGKCPGCMNKYAEVNGSGIVDKDLRVRRGSNSSSGRHEIG